MTSPPSRNALRDLIISVVWIVVCLIFLNIDRSRIASLHASGSHIPAMRWIQIPIWIGMLAFWVRNGWTSWQRFRANDSGSR
jgi:hypothetical protein